MQILYIDAILKVTVPICYAKHSEGTGDGAVFQISLEPEP